MQSPGLDGGKAESVFMQSVKLPSKCKRFSKKLPSAILIPT